MTSSVPEGYQPITRNGPRVRSDVVDVYVFTRGTPRGVKRPASTGFDTLPAKGEVGGNGVFFLQLLRSGPPLEKTWHPVMGHIEAGETAVECAKREAREELGLNVEAAGATHKDAVFLGMWALEQVHPFYIAAIDTIVFSPRFVVEVAPDWSPTLNAEHSEIRWVHQNEIASKFMWPGQIAACREVLSVIVEPTSMARDLLRIR